MNRIMITIRIKEKEISKFDIYRNEYWENEMYQKHLNEPFQPRWKPYAVLYTYEKSVLKEV